MLEEQSKRQPIILNDCALESTLVESTADEEEKHLVCDRETMTTKNVKDVAVGPR